MMNSSPQPSHRRVPISLGSDIGGCSCNRSFLIATAFVGISKNSTRLEIIDFPMCGRYRLLSIRQHAKEPNRVTSKAAQTFTCDILHSKMHSKAPKEIRERRELRQQNKN